MKYNLIKNGTFISRPNRFIAHIEMNGRTEVCHVKNTGRCRELLVPGAEVYLAEGTNPKRKTKWDLIAVKKGNILINMDAQAPNAVFKEWAESGMFMQDIRDVHPEYTWEDSRFDFRLEDRTGPMLVEVKGVTLEENGVVRFPDAPTERGVKHIRGLIRAHEHGIRTGIVFIIQMEGVLYFTPNDATHPAFGEALREAGKKGVEIYAYDCHVTPDSLEIHSPVPVKL